MSATTVRVSRNSKVANGVRPWKIMVDGKDVGSIPPHTEQVEVPVSPGQHKIYLESSGTARSRELSFEVKEGQSAGFTSRSRPFGALVVPFSVISLIKPDVWIILHPDNA